MRSNRRRGQVVVETAIIMPVFVFLILGLLQMGLLHHARVMTKYAAYKAARAGSLRQGNADDMKRAALAVMLPVLGRNSSVGAPYRTDDIGNYAIAWNTMKNAKQNGEEFVEVKLCNPVGNGVNNADFDDPRKAMTQSAGNLAEDPKDPGIFAGPGGVGAGQPGRNSGVTFDWKGFNATKLQVQVTSYYRMYIPFANWIVWRIAFGDAQGTPGGSDRKKLRWLGYQRDPGQRIKGQNTGTRTIDRLKTAADRQMYILPIRASYAMRMQSNFAGQGGTNNGSYTSKDCFIPWKM